MHRLNPPRAAKFGAAPSHAPRPAGIWRSQRVSIAYRGESGAKPVQMNRASVGIGEGVPALAAACASSRGMI